MPESMDGNASQVRLILDQYANAVVDKMERRNDEPAKIEMPTQIKWAAGIISALITAGVIGMAVWLVTSVSEMQVTLARMDERQLIEADAEDSRDLEQDRRILQLERYHQRGE